MPMNLLVDGEYARRPAVLNRPMVEALVQSGYLPDGSDFAGFARGSTNLYPILSGELGVTSSAYPFGHVMRYGAISYLTPLLAALGVDSAPAVNAAITAVKQFSSGSVYAPGGVYLVNSDIVLDAITLTLSTTPIALHFYGDGSTTQFLCGTGVNEGFIIRSHINTDGTGNMVFAHDFEIDGILTTGKTGLRVGSHSGVDEASARTRVTNVSVVRFDGVGGIGLYIKDSVDAIFNWCYFGRSYVNMRIEGTLSSLPTLTTFNMCAWREATTYGMELINSYNTSFFIPYVEANGLNGIRLITTGASNISLCEFFGGWFEGNFNTVALSRGYASIAAAFAAGKCESPLYAGNFHVVVDGSAGGTCSAQFRGNRYSNALRAINFVRAPNCEVDGINPVVLQTTATGHISATATGYKRDDGFDWASFGFLVGMQVNIVSGFPTATNNGSHVITAIDDSDPTNKFLSCAGTVIEVPPALQAIQIVSQTIFIDSASNGVITNWQLNNAPLACIANDAPELFTSIDTMWRNKVFVDANGHLIPRNGGTSLGAGLNIGTTAFRFQAGFFYTFDGAELVISDNASVNRLGVGTGALSQYGIGAGGTIDAVAGSGINIYAAATVKAQADNDILYALYGGSTFDANGKANVTCIALGTPNVSAGANNYALKTGTGQHSLGDELKFPVVGKGIFFKEGANAVLGAAVLVAGTIVVNTNKVTANSRIQLTTNVPGGTPGWVQVSARIPGTSFTILSSNVADTSTIAWEIREPA